MRHTGMASIRDVIETCNAILGHYPVGCFVRAFQAQERTTRHTLSFLGGFTRPHKVDESALHIQAGQLHLDLVTNFEPLLPAHHPPLGGRL